MKKLLSLLLSVVMIFSTFGTVPMASAAKETSPYGGPDYAAYPEEFEDYQWYAGWDYAMEWEEPENVWDDPWDKPVVIQTLLSADGDKWSDTLTVEPGQKFKARIRLAKNEIDYCQIDALEFTPVFRRSLFTVDQETSILLGITEGYVDEAYSGVAYNTEYYPADTPKFWILWGENGDTTTGLTFDMCEYELTASAEIPEGEYTITTDLPCSVTYWDPELGEWDPESESYLGDQDDKDRASDVDRLCYGITNATVTVAGGEEPDPVPATPAEVALAAGENAVVDGWNVTEWNATKGATVSVAVDDADGFESTVTVNDAPYTAGDAIELAQGTYTVVVETAADGYIDAVETYTITVPAGTTEDAVAPEVVLESITAPVNGWTVEGWKREIANQVSVAVADVDGFESTVTVNGEPYTAGDAIAVSKVGETFEVVVTTAADKYNTVENTYTITVGKHATISSADIATMPTITMSGSEGLEFVDVVTPNTGRGAGAIRNWTKGAEVTINVADNAEATSSVTVNGEAYTGETITLDTNAPLCVVVHTKEDGKISATKVYDIVVTKAEKAVLNSVTVELNGQFVDLTNLDSTVRTKTDALTSFVKGSANTMTISAVGEEGSTVKVAMRGENSVEPLTTNLPYAAQFTAVVTVIKAGRVTASYVIDIPVKEAPKAPLESVVISGIGADVTVDAPVASARTKAPTMAGFVKGEVDTITITPVVEDRLEAVVSFRGVKEPNALTATLPYASQFTATITVKGEGYQTAYYVIDIPVVK